MDSANKQTAIVAESTMGTTPSSPAFKKLRDVTVGGSPQRGAQRSPERRPDRMAANMVSGLASFPKSIDKPFLRDEGMDILWESLLCGAWSSNVLKNASTKKPFTLEEKYEGGATDPYRRLTGCLADSARISFPIAGGGTPGSISFGIKAMAEAVATTAIASSTYADPTPGYDPVSSIDIAVTNLFGISSPRLMGLDMTITNNMRERYAFGSASPWGIGLGLFDVQGSAQIYFSQASDYSAFMTRQSGLELDITIGSVTNYKDQLQIGTLDVWNPNVTDPGATGDHMVTLNFMGRYDASDAAVIKLTRLVA